MWGSIRCRTKAASPTLLHLEVMLSFTCVGLNGEDMPRCTIARHTHSASKHRSGKNKLRRFCFNCFCSAHLRTSCVYRTQISINIGHVLDPPLTPCSYHCAATHKESLGHSHVIPQQLCHCKLQPLKYMTHSHIHIIKPTFTI